VKSTPGNGRAVVGSEHEHHLDKLGRIRRESAFEPQQANHATKPNVFLEHVRDAHAGVQQFLATLVRNGGNERRRLADKSKFLAEITNFIFFPSYTKKQTMNAPVPTYNPSE
jgi:hypothetical protein